MKNFVVTEDDVDKMICFKICTAHIGQYPNLVQIEKFIS